MDLFGRNYLIEYVTNAFKERERDRLYKVYMTESVKRYLGLNFSYYEMAFPENAPREKDLIEEAKSASEIKQGMKDRLNKLGNSDS